MSFSIPDLHKLYKQKNKNKNKKKIMTFDLAELITCFEAFADKDMMGKDFMKQVLKTLDIDVRLQGLIAAFKEE